MPQRTLSQMRSMVWAALDNNTGFYPQAEVTGALNEQVRVANLFVGFIQDSATITTQAGRYFYAIPAPMVIPLAVSIDGKRLNRCAFPTLARRNRNWLKETTANSGPVMTWVPLGIRRLAIYPADAIGGHTLTVEGVVDPTPLVNGTDVVDAADEALDGIQQMAVHVLQLKEGGKIFADSTSQYQNFLRQMKLMEMYDDVKHPRFFLEKQQVKEGG